MEAERDEWRSIYHQYLAPATHFNGRDEGEALVSDLTAALATFQDYIDTVQGWLNRFQQTTLDLAASVNQLVFGVALGIIQVLQQSKADETVGKLPSASLYYT